MHPQQPYQPGHPQPAYQPGYPQQAYQPGYPQQAYQPGYPPQANHPGAQPAHPQQPGYPPQANLPGAQPVHPQQPGYPEQGNRSGHPQQFGSGQQADGSIEVTYVCDDKTARRLSRGAAWVNWLLPAKLGILFAIPAFLLARGTISLVSNGGDAEFGEMMGAFFIVLGFELVCVILITGWQLVRVSPKFTAVAGPGHRITARYTHDTMHLQQTSGAVANRYADIKRVKVLGDVVFLQPNGTQGFMLPCEVVPDAALTRLRGGRA
ncbi:hypothetical protein ACFWUP_16710 [Nocardia sp. NPDC058658]|uniref:hypothetical protein n=1 Tax=Nocardia sp. NPDC058658 TaxID=3346580 RepID=UPI0036493BFC